MSLGVNEMSKLTIDAQIHDLEYQAQNISQRKLAISQQLEQNAKEYEAATSNRQMKIGVFLSATGANNKLTDTSKTINLTYAALVSATANGLSTSKAGIKGNKDTSGQNYEAGSYFRLVDPDGAIVVSSADEIPFNYIEDTPNVKQELNSGKTVDGQRAQIFQDLQDATDVELSYGTYNNNGVIIAEYKDKDGKAQTKIYNAESGALETKTETKEVDKANGTGKETVTEEVPITIDDGVERAKKSGLTDKENDAIYSIETTKDDHGNVIYKVIETTRENHVYGVQDAKGHTVANSELSQMADGTYQIVDANGKPCTQYPKYRVDTNLKTKGNSPNYLQDCLRNGKYMLQQGNEDTDEKDFKWENVTWDSITSINDNYYTEDDDAAKAKYDRIQSQLNAQEKKLDLELDTIETQRSALTQEKESLDKCIEDAMDSFKTFA